MARFRKKPVEIEATQWLRSGNHPRVTEYRPYGEQKEDAPCKHCGQSLEIHGWLRKDEGRGDIVCPGDWIISGVDGNDHLCERDSFAAIYDRGYHAGRDALRREPAIDKSFCIGD